MAKIHRYIDYSGGLDSNGGTSDGDAWKTIAHAYATITNANSWQLNLKDNAEHVVAGPILPSYNPGAAIEDASIHHVGYTSVADDGGRWTIDCSAAQFMSSTTQDEMHFYNGKFRNWSTGQLIRLDDYNTFYGIEFDGEDTAKDCIQVDAYCMLANCWLHSLEDTDATVTYPVYVQHACAIIGNRVEVNQRRYGIRAYTGSYITDNLIISNNNTSGVSAMLSGPNGDNITLANNIIYNKKAGNTSKGIWMDWASNGNWRIMNNYVEGMDTNFHWGEGMQTNIRGGNVSYNGTTNDFLTDGDNDHVLTLEPGETVLTQSGLMDPENGDYRPNASLREAGVWPSWANDYADNQVGLFNKSVGWPQPRQTFREGIQSLDTGV